MHCLSLMTAVPSSEGFVPFVQRLENSSWSHYYMFFVWNSIMNNSNYQLDCCFPKIFGASYGDKFADLLETSSFRKL